MGTGTPPGWLVGKSSPSPVLRVRWIEHAQPALPTSPPDAHATPAPSADPSAPSPDPGRVARSLDPTQRPPDVAISASTPDYLAQGAVWAAESAPATDFQPGLMASRVPRLPGGASGGRFHMREPPSPQRRLQAIGRMLAGPDYTTDPCPRMHDNVHGLLTDTSDEGAGGWRGNCGNTGTGADRDRVPGTGRRAWQNLGREPESEQALGLWPTSALPTM